MHSRQIERQARRMGEMIDRLKVDRLKFACSKEGAVYFQARTVCLGCSVTRQCLDWLDLAPADALPPTFCPNYPLFASRDTFDEL